MSLDKGEDIEDPDAFIFNLTAKKIFKIQHKKKAIVCRKGTGPRFSGTFGVDGEPFNGKDKCFSRDEYANYECQVINGRDELI